MNFEAPLSTVVEAALCLSDYGASRLRQTFKIGNFHLQFSWHFKEKFHA